MPGIGPELRPTTGLRPDVPPGRRPEGGKIAQPRIYPGKISLLETAL
jgi:hypothetical protein